MAIPPSPPAPPSEASLDLSAQPPTPLLLRNLTSQSAHLSTLFSALSSVAPSAQPPHPAVHPIYASYSLLAGCTSELASLVDEVGRHQAAWARVQGKKREVIRLEGRVRGLIGQLEQGREELEEMVQRAREDVRGIDKVMLQPLNAKALLAHAIALGRTSSAPVSSLLAPAELQGSAPWPTEVIMRQGILFREEGGMGGEGQTGKIGDERNAMDVDEEVKPDQQQAVHREEPSRAYDPSAVFQLDLNSDESDGE